MRRQDIVFSLALLEGFQLVRIVDEFRDLVRDRDADDSAILRLTPSAYPDDSDAAATFADATHEDLLDRRLTEAGKVRQALVPFDVEVGELSDEEALAPRELVVREDDLDAWLRTLTAIRLVIADRLGITSEDDGALDGRHDVYEWLGYRLEVLIQAADEADTRRDP